MLDYRVISIGAMASHPLRPGSSNDAPASHATTTLVRSENAVILVDPSLPEPILAARLKERAGLRPGDVTHVFCSSFRPDVRRGLLAFDHATWWISERERETVGTALIAQATEASENEDSDLIRALEQEVAILKRFEAAPDQLAPHVDLFPLPGYTPGLAGLLLSAVHQTVLICGDAVATLEHLEQGKVMPHCFDMQLARESFAEAVEIAEVLILGRDNLAVNPLRQSMGPGMLGGVHHRESVD